MKTLLNWWFALIGKIGHFLLSFEEKREHILALRKKPVIPGVKLYHFQLSPYSAKVRSAIYHMNLNIPFTDVLVDQESYKDLTQKGGKDQVPCLRIDKADGTQWMYESRDIIAYLKELNGN
jgi:glutaredoxin